ncbi:zinc finger CCCH domain-containing protein 3 [Musca vetustissima]|uniref:zinc finger CCCH domain-containing protein 3 n=1 Tax=Musca vetustissima TaxID=27455 RepID=UPI002AB5E890|nr:zinc finger CCCH domain-containing protein 3 [Musca vetustissima]
MLPQNNNPRTIYINPNFKGTVQQQQLQQPKCLTPSILVPPLSSTSIRPPQIPASAHINPLFLERAQRPTIHMNPKFLLKLQDQQSTIAADKSVTPAILPAYIGACTNTLNRTTTISNTGNTEFDNTHGCAVIPDKPTGAAVTPVQAVTNNSTLIKPTAPEVRKIICKSKNRLIREPLSSAHKSLQMKPIQTVPSQPPIVHVTRRKLIRKSAIPDTTRTRTKQTLKLATIPVASAIKTKYKLDHRIVKKKMPAVAAPASVFKIKRKSFVGRFALRRTSTSSAQTTSICKKFGPPVTKNSNVQSMNKKLQLLNINGLLYKSTRNSLKLKDLTSNTSNVENKCKKPTAASNSKLPQGLTIFVRGTKYIMDPQKYKLTRVTAAGKEVDDSTGSPNRKGPTQCRRIDIGGFTYISTTSKNNVLIRTRNHLARAYVNNAKQKSLQILSKSLVKSNVPCPIYQRVGKCAAFERGKCLKVHNKQQVAICAKFLRGECLNSKCLLSHEVSLSKMPVCKFYMQGVCVRNDCPYLHKKLSDNAEVCIDFLRGYCQLADKCNKRHEFVCPEHERNGVCKIKNCVYCKSAQKREKHLQKTSELSAKKQQHDNNAEESENFSVKVTKDQQHDTSSAVRYFTGGTVDNSTNNPEMKENDGNKSHDSVNESDSRTEDAIRKRPKLGNLPAFIPL